MADCRDFCSSLQLTPHASVGVRQSAEFDRACKDPIFSRRKLRETIRHPLTSQLYPLCSNYAGSGSNSDLNERQLRQFPAIVFSVLRAGLVRRGERIFPDNPKVGGSVQSQHCGRHPMKSRFRGKRCLFGPECTAASAGNE